MPYGKDGKRRTHLFDGAASLLLPLVAAQLQGAVDIGFSVIGAQDEQSAETCEILQ